MYDLIEQHYRTNRQRILKSLAFSAGTPEGGEDVLQTAYERALRYHASCKPEDLGRWFSMIIKNALYDYRNMERGYSGGEIDLDEMEQPVSTEYLQHIMRDVRRIIDGKPKDQKEILSLYIEHEYRPIDIARITEHTYAKCHHIIERFKEEMTKRYK